MPIISNDPIFWPELIFYRVFGYFLGSWRANRMTLLMSWTVVLQLHPLLWWYTIGVSKVVIVERVIDNLWYSPALTFGQEVG